MMGSLFKHVPFDLGSVVELTLVIVASLLLASVLRKRFHYRKYNLPPGPFSWPIVGHLPFLLKDRQFYYIELAKKYGNIYSLYLGDKLHIVINDTDLIREALRKDAFMGRPPNMSIVPHTPSITELSGPKWKEQRQSINRNLKELFMGKTEEAAISAKNLSDMVGDFVDKLRRSEGKAVRVWDILMHDSGKLMFKMITGSSVEEGTKLSQVIEEFQSGFPSHVLRVFSSYLSPILKPFSSILSKNYLQSVNELAKIFDQEISRHENDPEFSTKKDYINNYLQEMKENHQKSHSRGILLANSANLIFAGAEATRQVLEFMFLTMVQYPEVQKKVYEEILNVVGKDRMPEWSERSLMPYTLSVFWEVIRHYNFFPLNESRYVLEDENLGGYDVPKGTGIIMVFRSSHMDPKIWDDPERFRPERFLSEDGKLLGNVVQNVMVFSKGKRSCPGENLARVSVFVYFAAVVQAFEILAPEGGIDTSSSFLVSVQLKNAAFVFKPRN